MNKMNNKILFLFTGPPYVRATGPIKAVAGSQLIIHCPFSGYPIDSIQWEKSRQEITSSKLDTNCFLWVFFKRFSLFLHKRFEI